MADADIAKKQWGYSVGGTGTDNTTVTAGDIYIRSLLLTANDSADTITVTDGAGAVLVDWKAPPECVTSVPINAKIKGLKVNPSATDDYCNVFVD